MEEILVPIFVVGGLWLMIGTVAVVAIWGGVKAKQEMNLTARRAIENGQQLSPELLNALQKPVKPAEQDIRGGIVLVALALGFIAAAFVGMLTGGADWEAESSSGFFIAAAIIGFLGLGQLVAGFMRREPKKDG
jgi:F0F1-type ATP synthase assembly protein I